MFLFTSLSEGIAKRPITFHKQSPPTQTFISYPPCPERRYKDAMALCTANFPVINENLAIFQTGK